MNYVRITTSYQDGRDIVYVSSLGLGRTMGEAEDNCEKTLFKFHPQVKPYYNGIHSCNLHSDYDFELEDVYTELRGLGKTPELMQILLDYLPTAITRRLPGIQVISEVTTKSTPNGYVVSVDLRDKDGNEFTMDAGYDTKRAIHVSIFSDKDNRYVSDTAKGWPPECPDIRELLNQYYKHLDRARSGKEEAMKQFKGSMRRKQESLSKKNEDTTEIAGMSVEKGSIAEDVLDWAEYEAGEGDGSVKDMLSELQEKGVRSGITFLITREDGVKFFDEHKQEINKILGDYIYNINGGPFTYQGWDEEDPLALNENNQDCLAAFAFEQVALDLLDKMED